MSGEGASTTDEYLAALPPDRRAALTTVRQIVRDNLPPGFEEGMIWDAMCWYIPLSRYADTYNGKPLGLLGLSSMKQHMSLYLMAVYGDPALRKWFEQAFRKAGKPLVMGKSCVRFKSLDDLPLDVIAEVIGKVSVDEYIAQVEKAQAKTTRGKKKAAAKKKAVAKKTPAKKAAKKTPAKKATAKKAAKKATAKKKSPAKKSPAKQAAKKAR